jgi:hypothetical protein
MCSRSFSDNEFRKKIAKSLRNDTVRTFLLKEFEKFSFGYRADCTAPIQNKVGAFLADPLLDRILTAPKKDLHIRRIMDQGEVLLVNLAKGHIGEESSSLLGGLLVTTIGLAAFSRADTPPAERRDFFVYIDEFQSFTTLALANMLSELRKYVSASLSPINISTSLSRTCATQSWATPAPSSHSGLASKTPRFLFVNSTRGSGRLVSYSCRTTASTSSS